MKNNLGRKKLKEKDKASYMIPVRINSNEKRLLKKLAEEHGEVYLTKVIRGLITEACRKAELSAIAEDHQELTQAIHELIMKAYKRAEPIAMAIGENG